MLPCNLLRASAGSVVQRTTSCQHNLALSARAVTESLVPLMM